MMATLIHPGGTTKTVTVNGRGGEGCIQIYWPIAGCYEVSLATGRIVADGDGDPAPAAACAWQLGKIDLRRLRKTYR